MLRSFLHPNGLHAILRDNAGRAVQVADQSNLQAWGTEDRQIHARYCTQYLPQYEQGEKCHTCPIVD